MTITTLAEVPGHEIASTYSDLLWAGGSRISEALEELAKKAQTWGANAVLGVRCEMATPAGGWVAYGTAAVIRPRA